MEFMSYVIYFYIIHYLRYNSSCSKKVNIYFTLNHVTVMLCSPTAVTITLRQLALLLLVFFFVDKQI